MVEQSSVRTISETRQKRLEAENNKKQKIIKTPFSKDESSDYEEGISHAQKVFWPFLFACAIVSDFSDLIPVVGFVLKLIALSIIWYTLYIKLKTPGYLDNKYKIEVSWRVRLFFRALGIADIVPFVSALPLTTLSVFIVWYKVKKQIDNKKSELVLSQQARQNKIYIQTKSQGSEEEYVIAT